ncbi:UNVERIFIED_CONTAM: hypothetical protein NCL1_36008 [Trichonephila clavipes]
MLNDDEIVTSCKKNPILLTMKRMKTRTTTTKVTRVHQILTLFCVRNSFGVLRTTIRVLSYSTSAAQENQRPCSEKTKVKLRHFAPVLLFIQPRFPLAMIFQIRIVSGPIYYMDSTRFRLSERCPVPIDSVKRRSTVTLLKL